MAVLKGESPLVVILPTGGGKSLLFMLPASLPDANTTIVVVPFTSTQEVVTLKAELLGGGGGGGGGFPGFGGPDPTSPGVPRSAAWARLTRAE